MKVLSVRERTVALGSNTANAAIKFTSMTASAVVVEIETPRGRFRGLGFSSIGRYGHGGLLNERFIPRLLSASPDDLSDPAAGNFSMSRLWDVLMADEKEGGHGERSGAVAVLETAMWDAWAKSEGLPLWALIEREFGHAGDDGLPAGQTAIYASGGHYRTGDEAANSLADEVRAAFDAGYGWFKLKVGGASESVDQSRTNEAVEAAEGSKLVAVDANCVFDGIEQQPQLANLDKLGLRWIEEPVNPLNYAGLAELAASAATPFATGENIFSVADAENLLRYGGLTSGRDILQMDIVLSYGLTEYVRMIDAAQSNGWSRRDFIPHAGHQVALHASAGLGLGAHETAHGVGGPFDGVSEDTVIQDGIATLGDTLGAGIELKPEMYRYFDDMITA